MPPTRQRAGLPVALALALALVPPPAAAGTRSAEWCERQWLLDSGEAVPKGADKPPIDAVDGPALVAKWKARAPECAGTVAYEARLAIALLVARQPEAARQALRPVLGVTSEHARLVKLASFLLDNASAYVTGEPTLEDVKRTTQPLAALVEAYPDFPEAHALLGANLNLLGRHEEAIRSLELASRASFNQMGVQRALTISYEALGRHREAWEAADGAVRLSRALYADPDFMMAAAAAAAALGEDETAYNTLLVLGAKVPDVRGHPAFTSAFMSAARTLDRRTLAAIEEALAALLRRPQGALVVFTVGGTGQLVRLTGSRDEPLLLDLPARDLTPEGRARAAALFEEAGGGRRPLPLEAFQARLGRDPARAAELALRVLRDVHGAYPTLKLKIDTEEAR